KLQQVGGVPVTPSNSTGYVVDANGIDAELLRQIKEGARCRIHESAERRGDGARFIEGGSVWDVPVAIALPGATQNELDGDAARTLIRNGVQAVSEGANMPCTPEAVAVFGEAGVAFGPGQAANAGGVATSALEMQQ